jgi:hypothetical protein
LFRVASGWLYFVNKKNNKKHKTGGRESGMSEQLEKLLVKLSNYSKHTRTLEIDLENCIACPKKTLKFTRDRVYESVLQKRTFKEICRQHQDADLAERHLVRAYVREQPAARKRLKKHVEKLQKLKEEIERKLEAQQSRSNLEEIERGFLPEQLLEQ